MIEKIMKAVKSSNKRRGRNITIGAVVGFLLSCTAVMGADSYLWIKEDSGKIQFNKAATVDDDGSWNDGNPYSDNNWDTGTKTYTNNIELSSNGANGKDGNYDISYGLRLSGNLNELNFINNGSITGEINNNDGDGYGIYNSDKMGYIENTGKISGSGSNNGYGYGCGIYNHHQGTMKNIENAGIISGQSHGIYNYSGVIDNITNTGIISGSGTTGMVFGVYNSNDKDNANNKIENIANTGVIYGENNAIKSGSGTIGDVNNYGILATQGNSVVDGITTENNYGMYITKKDEQIIITVDNDKLNDEPIEVVVGYDKDGNGITKSMTIRNAKLNEEETETVSFEFKGKSGKYNNSILNGKDKTLNVLEGRNKITDSIINAYQTAVVMKGKNSSLVLNNTVVNGGAAKDKEVPTIEIEGEDNALTLKGESIVNTGAENSIAITVGGKDNALVLEGNAKVNGKIESTGTNNLISLNGNAGNGMNILHNISGFTNMNIDNNVTFFENVEVTGTETVTVGGTLNLRLKKSEPIPYGDIPTAVHAFSGTDSTIIKGASEEEAGTLNFITNGIGREIYVDMKNIELENMKVRANSIIDKAEIDGDYIHLGAGSDLSGIVNPKVSKYDSLDKIYKSLYSSTEENLDALRDILSMTYLGTHYGYNTSNKEQLKNLMSYLDSIYTGTPYSVSSELSRRSAGMFRDIVTENQFRPDLNRWLVMGGLTHTDGGTKDSYYGQNYHGIDIGTADVDTDMKLTGAYALGKYGYSENVSLGVTAGG
ncbi:autotransporter domain-containing protein, partial [Fusobacterium varium]|uniref:autotransporter domain-containing protein n=1 Tax=Fusobacterium varium TaxID=856 RepID=UPI00266CA409